jgi:hypothetical protein
VSNGYVRVEPLSALAGGALFVLGGVTGLAALAWHYLRAPTIKESK